MPGAFPLQSLVRAVNGVKTVGQATAALAAAQSAAAAGRIVAGNDLPTGIAGAVAGSGSAGKTIARLDNAVERMRSAGVGIVGGRASTGVGASWSKIAAPRVSGVYENLFDIYDRAGRPPSYLDGLVADFSRTVEAYSDKMEGQGLLERAGTILGDVGGSAARGVGNVGKGVGAGVTVGLGGIFGSIWKPLVAAVVVLGVVGVVYVTVQSKALRI